MPTKRTRTTRTGERITRAAVDAYRTARQFEATYTSCVQSERDCPHATFRGNHCDDCKAFLDASRALHLELGLRPWEPGPIEIDGGPCPYGGTAYAAYWPKAQALRAELERILEGQ
jgi:hypothetical protein